MILILLVVIAIVVLTFVVLVKWGEKDGGTTTRSSSQVTTSQTYAHENTHFLPQGFWDRLDALVKNGAPKNFWDTVDFLVCLGEAMSLYDEDTLIEISIRRMSPIEAETKEGQNKQTIAFFDLEHAKSLYGSRYSFLQSWDSYMVLNDKTTTAAFLEEERLCELIVNQGLESNPQAPHAYIAKCERVKYTDVPCPQLNILVKYRPH